MENYLVQKKKLDTQIKYYVGITALILISMIFYTVSHFQEYSALKKLTAANASYITALQNEVAGEKAEYDTEKVNFDALTKEIENKLESIFPDGNNYTELTKQVDTFEEELSKRTNLFEVSNIDYQDVEKGDLYSILPVRMTIKSSNDNFRKFLHWVENSGSLTDKVRLMDITSIRLNFQEDDTLNNANSETISFTVQMNAYFK